MSIAFVATMMTKEALVWLLLLLSRSNTKLKKVSMREFINRFSGRLLNQYVWIWMVKLIDNAIN